MLYPCDTHTHSDFSIDVPHDRKDSIGDLCAAAVEKGLMYLAVTDHFDIDRHYSGQYEPFPFEAIDTVMQAQKAKWAGKLYLAHGIEYGEPFAYPDEIRKILSAHPYDIVLGSLHHIPEKASYSRMDYRQMTDGERLALSEEYLTAYRQLALCDGFDIYTHPTYLMRYFFRQNIPFDLSVWEEYMKSIFRIIIEKGAGIEYNTSYMRSHDGIPDYSVITAAKWYYECGGTILTIGSDAHAPADVYAGIRTAEKILSDIGFRYYAVYKERQPYFYRLS